MELINSIPPYANATLALKVKKNAKTFVLKHLHWNNHKIPFSESLTSQHHQNEMSALWLLALYKCQKRIWGEREFERP